MCDASTVGNIGLGAQVAGAVGTTYAAYRKSAGEKTGYEYQAAVAKNNAQLSDWQAQDALNRGKTASQTSQLNTAQLYGRQQSIFASRNVAINEGSALNILADTKFMGARDAATITDNAAKEAWGYRVNAQNQTDAGQFLDWQASQKTPGADALGTALTAGGAVASSWYALRNKTITAGA